MRYSQGTYWIGGKTSLGFLEAIEKVKEALKAEGFGVLCDMDVQTLLKNKLGLDTAHYQILGTCNPQLSHQALDFEPDLGVLLPCNFIVYQKDGGIWIKAIDPAKMLSVVENPALDPIASQIRKKIEGVFTRLP